MELTKEEVSDLRQTLSEQLDESCQFLSKASCARKRVDSLQMLLYAKRDIAKRKLCETVQNLEEKLEKLKNDVERSIQEVSKEKDQFLSTEKDRLLKVIQEVDLLCSDAEAMLHAGKEGQLMRDGPHLSIKLRSIMSRPPRHAPDDISMLDFVPLPAEEYDWTHTNVLGYVRSSALKPEDVTVLNCANQALVDIEEIITVKYAGSPVENWEKMVKVSVHGPGKCALNVERKSNVDGGSFTASFTPTVQGEHEARVTVYDADITGSPFRINVCQVTSEVSSQDSDMDKTGADVRKQKRVRINRSMIQAVRNHINLNIKPLPEPVLCGDSPLLPNGKLPQTVEESESCGNRILHNADTNAEKNTSLVSGGNEDGSKRDFQASTSRGINGPMRSRQRTSSESRSCGQVLDRPSQLPDVSAKWDSENSNQSSLNMGMPRNAATTYFYNRRGNSISGTGKAGTPRSAPPELSNGEVPFYSKSQETKPGRGRGLELRDSVFKQRYRDTHRGSSDMNTRTSAGGRDKSYTSGSPPRPHLGRVKSNNCFPGEDSANAALSDVSIHSGVLSDGVTGWRETRLENDDIPKRIEDIWRERDAIPKTKVDIVYGSDVSRNKEAEEDIWHDDDVIPRTKNREEATWRWPEETGNTRRSRGRGCQRPNSSGNQDENNNRNKTAIKACYVRTIGRQGDQSRDKEGLSYPIGVTVNKMQEILVCDNGHNCVKVYDWAGGLKLTIRGAGMTHPSAVVTNARDDIFVKDDRQVSAYSRDGTPLCSFGRQVLKKPYGLALNDKGNLVLIDLDWGKPRLCEFSQTGDLIAEHSYTKLLTADRQTKCRFLEVHADKVIVVDLGLNKIYLSTRSGKTLSEFGEYGLGEGRFNQPSGVAADRHGNLIIADSKNDRIQFFTPDGAYAGRMLLEAPLKRPSDVCVTSDDFLLVSCLLGHCVQVYKLLPP